MSTLTEEQFKEILSNVPEFDDGWFKTQRKLRKIKKVLLQASRAKLLGE